MLMVPISVRSLRLPGPGPGPMLQNVRERSRRWSVAPGDSGRLRPSTESRQRASRSAHEVGMQGHELTVDLARLGAAGAAESPQHAPDCRGLSRTVWLMRLFMSVRSVSSPRQTWRLIGKVAIQVMALNRTRQPATVRTHRRRRLLSLVLTPAKNSTTAYSTTVST